jgi:hypothetical protein
MTGASFLRGELMSAVENIKEIADLIKKYNNIELNRKILALEDEVIDLTPGAPCFVSQKRGDFEFLVRHGSQG